MSKWLTYTPTTGRKNGTINVTASMNDTNSARNNILNIFNTQYDVKKKVSFKQRSSVMPIVLTLDRNSLPWDGGDFIVNVQCQGGWLLEAPADIHLEKYEGFGNTAVIGHVSYNFDSEAKVFTINGNSGEVYYDSVKLAESGMDVSNNTVYRYIAIDDNGTPVQVGYYKGYKNNTEISYTHLTNEYTGESAVIWDDIIDSVMLRYYEYRAGSGGISIGNHEVRAILGMSNPVILEPSDYSVSSGSTWLSYRGWRMYFYEMVNCEYMDMRNIIPSQEGFDMGCMFQHSGTGILDISTWNISSATVLYHTFEGIRFVNGHNLAPDVSCINASAAFYVGQYAVKNGFILDELMACDLNRSGSMFSSYCDYIRTSPPDRSVNVYYPETREDEWNAVKNSWIEGNYIPYNKDNFIISPLDTVEYNSRKRTTEILPIFSSSEWTIRTDSSWISFEKVLSLGYRLHLKENIGDIRVGHIYVTNEQGLTTTIEIVQKPMFYIAYTTVDDEPLNIKSMFVYKYDNLNMSDGQDYAANEIYVDGEWRLYFVDEPAHYHMSGINGESGSRIKEFRGASLPCIIRNLYFTNNTYLESVDLENITLWYNVFIPRVSPTRYQPNIFMGCSNLKEMDWEGMSRIKGQVRWYNSTSPVPMVFDDTFNGCFSLEYADITPILMTIKNNGLGNGTSRLFKDCVNLKTVRCDEVGGSSLSGVRMFEGCSSLQTFNGGITKFDIDAMFNGCGSLRTVTISANIKNNMFKDCIRLEQATFIGNFVVSNGESAFENCGLLTTLDLSGGDFNTTTSISRMFYNCTKLNTVKLGIYAYFNYDGNIYGYSYGYLKSWNNAFDGTTGGTIQIPTNAVLNKRDGWDLRNQWDHFYPEDKWTVVKY